MFSKGPNWLAIWVILSLLIAGLTSSGQADDEEATVAPTERVAPAEPTEAPPEPTEAPEPEEETTVVMMLEADREAERLH
jgi:hypothetical protein